MGKYEENFKSKMDWQNVFVRTSDFPLDRSSMFGSLEDAKKYASGDGSDDRELGFTSYVGQIITVYENGETNIYQINEDRDLQQIATNQDLLLNEERLLSQSGSTYDCANGVLTLKTINEENSIAIQLDSNYGTF